MSQHLALAPALPIPRHSDLDVDGFRTRFLFANQPVVITDALSQWRAVGTWNPDLFRERFGSRTIQVDDESLRVADFVDRVVEATPDRPAPYLKGTGVGNYLVDLFPELVDDVQPVPEHLSPNWLADRFLIPQLTKRLNRGPRAEIFFGGFGSGFPYLHWDTLHFHAFNGQVYGEKKWLLFAPDQSPYLYPRAQAMNQSQIGDVFGPDLERFPLFAQATRYEATLGEGELLFVPAGWWHTTRMERPSISVAMNCANASNWAGVRADLVENLSKKSRVLAAILNTYLGQTEKRKRRRDRARGLA